MAWPDPDPDLIELPWGGYTTRSTLGPCTCGFSAQYEVAKIWKRIDARGRAPYWRGTVEVICPRCLALDPRARGREVRQHMGWQDRGTGVYTLDPGALSLPVPAGVVPEGEEAPASPEASSSGSRMAPDGRSPSAGIIPPAPRPRSHGSKSTRDSIISSGTRSPAGIPGPTAIDGAAPPPAPSGPKGRRKGGPRPPALFDK